MAMFSSTSSLSSRKPSLSPSVWWTTMLGFVILCLITPASSQVDIPLGCQQGWTLDGHHCYKLFTNAMPWKTAERVCMMYGGHQATPFDYYENEAIGTFVNDRGVDEYWLGANRMNALPNDNRELEYSGGLTTKVWVGRWYIDHPDFDMGECVYVISDKEQLHKWKLGPCAKRLPFLCQRPVCSNGSFHCANGNCVGPTSNRCDGFDDCGDGSDEMDCPQNCKMLVQVTDTLTTVRYPSGGGNYPNNADCVWRFEAQLGHNVELNIKSLNLAMDLDEVILLEGGLTEGTSDVIDPPLRGQLTSANNFFYSSSNLMILKFRSDGAGTSTGFELTHRQVMGDANTEQTLMATDIWQEKVSSFYPNYVLGSKITPTSSQQLTDLDLPEGAHVVVRDGGDVFADVIATLMGDYKGNGNFPASGNELYINLHTEKGGANKGLKIRYKQGCDGMINQISGYISSPGMPVTNYPNGVMCTWTVTVPQNQTVTIVFNTLDLDRSDHLMITDSTNNQQGPYTGNTPPGPLSLSGGSFTVMFRSDSTLNSKGFNISYSINCPMLNIDMALSIITSGSQSQVYGSTFTIACKAGSQFTQSEHMGKAEVEVMCGAYGRWNVNTTPKCERVLCPKAPDVQNAYIVSSTGGLAYNGTVTYECYPGFTASGSRTIMCDINGDWSTLPTCSVSMCPTPALAISNGEGNVTQGDGQSYGSVVRYTCNDGYDLVGDPTLFCNSSGTWIGSTPQCHIQTCFMADIAHGSLSSNKVNVGGTITVTCDSGYTSTMPGVTTTRCLSNRTLTNSLACEDVNECANAACDQQCVNTEGSFSCECFPGYELDTIGRSCQDIDECANNPCTHTCTNTPGSYMCSCPPGYVLYASNGTEGFMMPPMEDGTRAGDVYRINNTCVPVMCQALPMLQNVDLLTGKTQYHYTDIISYKCKLGYVMQMQNPAPGNLTCNETGHWVGPEIQCLTATCSVNPNPSGLMNPGTVTPSVTSVNYGQEITINCTVPGFMPTTFTRKRMCTLIGMSYMLDGSDSDYECGMISCGTPPNVPGATYSSMTGMNFKDTFMFSCLTGFTLDGISSMTGNMTVTCQAHGQWDFGSLQCIGAQCKDPGQIHLGKQVYSDYRDGQRVEYQCTKAGYELDPPNPISCSVQTGTPQFNASLPSCIDVERPNITNCPTQVILVNKYTSPLGFVPTPVASDNGGIKSMTVNPAWPSSHFYINDVSPPVTYTFTVADYGNNMDTCTISLQAKDDIPPTITCPPTRTFTFRKSMDVITTTFSRDNVTIGDDVTPPSDLRVVFVNQSTIYNYTFRPDVQLGSSFPPTHYVPVSVMVFDEANNSASCNMRLYYEPDKCSPYSLREPPNAVKSCIENGQGYTCTITCNNGYKLFSDVTQTSANVTCTGPGQAFSPSTDFKCVNLSSEAVRSSYELVYNFTYDGINVSQGCVESYKKPIEDTLMLYNDNKTIVPELCQPGSTSLGSLTVNEATNKIFAQYVIKYSKSVQNPTSCSEISKVILMSEFVPLLLQLEPLQCQPFTMSTRAFEREGYVCDNSLVTPSARLCLVCPEGTIRASDGSCSPCPRGTYGMSTNQTQCTPCDSNTSTYMKGAVSRTECTAECSAGTYNALTGLPPCEVCPLNTYWVNATTCSSCPLDTATKTTGATDVDQCRDKCQPGHFNPVDGHEDCTACPFHHYIDTSGQTNCTECASDRYTNRTGSTSALDCLPLSGSTECATRCINGQCRDLIPHIKSCVCNEGYFGEYCEQSFNPCLSTPCYNGGTCNRIGTSANYTCSCPAGTSGNKCEEIISTCISNPCQNNGMCENLVGAYECHCLLGFSGDNCQIQTDICMSQPCKNGGMCTAQGTVRYKCTCQQGYTGPDCEESIDDCYASPCRNNATCVDAFEDYDCMCDVGFTGMTCETRMRQCMGVNCGPGGRCVEDDLNNNFLCVCNEFSKLNGTCSRKDFCASDPCLQGAACVNQETTYLCNCPTGYEGSRCQHLKDACKSNPCMNGADCEPLVNDYMCHCPAGYTGKNCATNIDECLTTDCGPNGRCMDMINEAMCQCNPGYTGNNCQTDIDECQSDPCLHKASCQDAINDYTCDCPDGWSGKNCEMEDKLCSVSTCSNNADCINYFNGFFCKCLPNTYGQTCGSVSDICQVANPCVHGQCSVMAGQAECTCDQSYEGERCNMLLDFCAANTSICKNDAECMPMLDDYECDCPSGYAQKDCSFNTDDCARMSCPATATCIDMEAEAFCRCNNLDMEGPNCDRNWDQNFDFLFDDAHKTGMAYLPYPIELNSNAFSVTLWVQFGEKGGQGTLLTLMTVPEDNSLRGKSPLLWINETTVHYNDMGNMVTITHNIDYRRDGKWHYLVVNVDHSTGMMHFIVDTIRSPPANISKGMIDVNLWMMLGSKYDEMSDMPVEGEGFYGKLSKVTIYSRALDFVEEVTKVGNVNPNALFSDSILRWGSELRYSTGVQRQTPSVVDRSCPFGYANASYPTCNQLLPGKNKVEIANGMCPENVIKYNPNRVTQVMWTTPTFSGQATTISSLTSGDFFTWGKYPVVIEASNTDGNKALCLFKIYVQSHQCPDPIPQPTPPNADPLQCSPTPAMYKDYRQCALKCHPNYAPSIPSPLIYTCGPVGNWDPRHRFDPYRVTPCGEITQPTRQLVIKLHYAVPSQECDAVNSTLHRLLRETQVKLNGMWNRVCTMADCSDTVIEVVCSNARRKRQTNPTMDLDVTLTLYDILDEVTRRSNSSDKMKTEDLYRNLGLFDYSLEVADAVPTGPEFTYSPGCMAPTVLHNDICVDCGPGTFYSEADAECQFCPIGQYQPMSGQRNCTPCDNSETTQTTGSISAGECHTSCPAGQRFDITNNSCVNCSIGFYQPLTGQFSCLPCPADKTTKYTGTVLESSCSNSCPPGQEIGTADQCVPCQIGFYRQDSDPYCLPCPLGLVTPNISTILPADCNVANNLEGTYRNRTNPLMFADCPIGTYQDQKWQYDCIKCGANLTTENERSTSASDCKFYCPDGQQKIQNQDSCELCPKGTYNDGASQFDQCEACPSPFTTPQAGSISALNCTIFGCAVGQQPNPAGNGCDPCPQGTYQDKSGEPQCISCASGFSTQGVGATNASACESFCPPGEEKINGTCVKCEIGFYKDNSVNVLGSCQRCMNTNYVTPTTGSISNDNCTVLNCQEGYKANYSTQQCDPCPRGTYQDQKYQNSCLSCGADEFTRHPNSTQASDCETYCESGQEKNGTMCMDCPRGFYKDNTIDVFMPCTACDPMFVTPEGPPAISSLNCTVRNCPAGEYINGQNCTKCPLGQYQDKPWQMNCTKCPTDRGTAQIGSTSEDQCLLNCSAGTENPNGTDICEPCQIGYYKDAPGTTSCQMCADFDKNDIKITAITGATSFADCTKLVCLPGYYPGNTVCTLCGYGTYQPMKWEDSCMSCPAGQTTYYRGAKEVTDCEPECSDGQGLVNGTCTECGIGTYNDGSRPDLRECITCPVGTSTLVTGATSVTQCNIRDCSVLGQYRDSTDDTCKDCPRGQYQDQIRQESCKQCPSGLTTENVKSTNVSDCKRDCQAGTQLNENTDTCEQCPIGTYRSKKPGEESWTCIQCPNDFTTAGAGSDDSADCSLPKCDPGYGYNNVTKSCQICPLNTYQNLAQQYLPCKVCPNNKITSNQGSTQLNECVFPCENAVSKCGLDRVCVNVGTSYTCDCKPGFQESQGSCQSICELNPDYCGAKGICEDNPFGCSCLDGFSGPRCDIRPDAESLSDNETETIIIAVVTTVCGLLFLILLIVCICVMARRRPEGKTPMASEVDDRGSLATRSMKGIDDYPTFAVNPVFNSRPPSIFAGPVNGGLAPQSMKAFDNAIYQPDDDNDPAVYRA